MPVHAPHALCIANKMPETFCGPNPADGEKKQEQYFSSFAFPSHKLLGASRETLSKSSENDALERSWKDLHTAAG